MPSGHRLLVAVVAAAITVACAQRGPATSPASAGRTAPGTASAASPGTPSDPRSGAPTDDATGPSSEGLPDLGLPRSTVTLAGPGGGEEVAVDVLVAGGPGERSQGLKGVTDLPPDAGMLFRFPGDVRSGFYMEDTLLPLSIAFADADGVVLTVLDMDPCRQRPCEIYDPGVTYRAALEVNQGFFDQIGLRPGWRIVEPPGLPPAG